MFSRRPLTPDREITLLGDVYPDEPRPRETETPQTDVSEKQSPVTAPVQLDTPTKEPVLEPSEPIIPDPPGVHELNNEELQLLLRNSRLGTGVHVTGEDAPLYRVPAVAPYTTQDVSFLPLESGTKDVTTVYSARAAAYIKHGWGRDTLAEKLSWVTGSLDPTTEFSVAESAKRESVYVTGRFLVNMCQVSFAGRVHPSQHLQEEVKAALACGSKKQRKAGLDKVWRQYGHVYVASVEMGGMLHTTSRQPASEENKLKEQMGLVLDHKFRHAMSSKHSDGGRDISALPTKQPSPFENEIFATAGGIPHELDILRWKTSLVKASNWAVTRVLRVEPIIALFDDKTRAEIIYTMTSTTLPFETGFVSGAAGNIDKTITYSSDPNSRLLLGLKTVDFDHRRDLRANAFIRSVRADSADVGFKTWENSISYNSAFSWLRLVTSEDDIQFGQYDLEKQYKWTNPMSQVTVPITFNKPYTEPPQVIVWLDGLNTSYKANIRVKIWTENVTNTGFTLRTQTWDGSTFYWGRINWLAHDANRKDIASGRIRAEQNGSELVMPGNQGKVNFGATQFSSPPRVFVALAGLDIDKRTNARFTVDINEVTVDGMTYTLAPWLDTLLYSADAVWIAF